MTRFQWKPRRHHCPFCQCSCLPLLFFALVAFPDHLRLHAALLVQPLGIHAEACQILKYRRPVDAAYLECAIVNAHNLLHTHIASRRMHITTGTLPSLKASLPLAILRLCLHNQVLWHHALPIATDTTDLPLSIRQAIFLLVGEISMHQQCCNPNIHVQLVLLVDDHRNFSLLIPSLGDRHALQQAAVGFEGLVASPERASILHACGHAFLEATHELWRGVEEGDPLALFDGEFEGFLMTCVPRPIAVEGFTVVKFSTAKAHHVFGDVEFV